ncbi:MAG: hypothetical protein ACRC57_00540 [Sarcina sp.]
MTENEIWNKVVEKFNLICPKCGDKFKKENENLYICKCGNKISVSFEEDN